MPKPNLNPDPNPDPDPDANPDPNQVSPEQCLTCSIGTSCMRGSTSETPCNPGRFSASEGKATCDACPAGTFQDKHGGIRGTSDSRRTNPGILKTRPGSFKTLPGSLTIFSGGSGTCRKQGQSIENSTKITQIIKIIKSGLIWVDMER